MTNGGRGERHEKREERRTTGDVSEETRGDRAAGEEMEPPRGWHTEGERKRKRPRETVKSASGTLAVLTSLALLTGRVRERGDGESGSAGVGGGWTSRYFICH